MNLRSNGL